MIQSGTKNPWANYERPPDETTVAGCEKGEADGTADALQILEAIVQTREPLT